MFQMPCKEFLSTIDNTITVNYPSPKGNGFVTALWYDGLLLPHLVVQHYC